MSQVPKKKSGGPGGRRDDSSKSRQTGTAPPRPRTDSPKPRGGEPVHGLKRPVARRSGGAKPGTAAPSRAAAEPSRPQLRRLPPQDRSPRTLLELYRPDVAALLTDAGVPNYRYLQAYRHFFHRPLAAFTEATDLPAALRDSLARQAPSTLTVEESLTAADGTTKLLLATHDGAYLESVIMRYSDRVTLCLSSQIGCAVGCVFCATGSMGFGRNLSAAEIVDQARIASRMAADEGLRVSNVVYMGMGEPLLNLQAVLDSVRILTDPEGFGLSHRSLSISTVGIPSGIRRLGRTEPQVNLALSLHAADDDTRALLIPKRFCHPLAEVLEAAWDHFGVTRRKLLVEYVLLGGINDSPEQARALARLLRGHVVAVNLLAWNPVLQGARVSPTSHAWRRGQGQRSAEHTEAKGRTIPLRAPAAASVAAFREVLASNRIEVVVRRSKGGTIQGACGQLAGRRKTGS